MTGIVLGAGGRGSDIESSRSRIYIPGSCYYSSFLATQCSIVHLTESF